MNQCKHHPERDEGTCDGCFSEVWLRAQKAESALAACEHVRDGYYSMLQPLNDRAEKAEAEVERLRVIAELVEKRCREAVPGWAPELRAALAEWRSTSPSTDE